jgi:Domain of unknown function (DUF4265)
MSEISLVFPLEVSDGWPPVGSESVPFELCNGGYRALVSPLFIKDLSVNDVISAELAADNSVRSWHHLHRSDHTTVWLLRLKRDNRIEEALERLRTLGCNTTGFSQAGCYSVDVPGEVDLADVDEALSILDEESVGVAYPSMRHEEG